MALALPTRLNRRKLEFVAAASLVLLGFVVRWGAARNDLWLDEIVSLQWAQRAESPFDIFRVAHDNNHFLNTLCLFFMGTETSPGTLRLPAVIAGSLSVAICMVAARPYGRLASWSAGLLMATSHLAIHYSSEARGYAFLMLFAPLAWVLLQRSLGRDSLGNVILYTASCLLGLLSHLTFLFCFAALCASSMSALLRRESSWAQALAKWCFVNGAAVVMIGVFCLTHVVRMGVGGGDPNSLHTVVREFAARVLSSSVATPLWGVSLSLVLLGWLLFGLSWAHTRRGEGADPVVFAIVLFAMPIVLLWLKPSDYLYPRYFLVWLPFLYVWMGAALQRSACGRGEKPRQRAVWLAGILGAVCLAQLPGIIQLAREGRGQYAAAIRLIVEEHERAGDRRLAISGGHSIRDGIVLNHYLTRLRPHLDWGYIDRRIALPADAPRWLVPATAVIEAEPTWLLHHVNSGQAVPKQLTHQGNGYLAFARFDSAPLSGWGWQIYRLNEQPE